MKNPVFHILQESIKYSTQIIKLCVKDFSAFQDGFEARVLEAREQDEDPTELLIICALVGSLIFIPSYNLVSAVIISLIATISYFQLKIAPATGAFYIAVMLLMSPLTHLSAYVILGYMLISILFMARQLLSSIKFNNAFKLELVKLGLLCITSIYLNIV